MLKKCFVFCQKISSFAKNKEKMNNLLNKHFLKIFFWATSCLLGITACDTTKNQQEKEQNQLVSEENSLSDTSSANNLPKKAVYEEHDAVGFKMRLMQISMSKKAAQRQMTLLDVRSIFEYEKAHIENAVNVDAASPDFKQQLAQKVPSGTPVFVYADNTENARKAAEIIKSMDYPAVFVLLGGFKTWLKEKQDAVFAS
jgi:rhodanese-related sulfurtransferase